MNQQAIITIIYQVLLRWDNKGNKMKHNFLKTSLLSLLLTMSCMANIANAGLIFSNNSVVTSVTNTVNFTGISGSLFGYIEDGVVVSVSDFHCCYSNAYYGSGGNYEWVSISLLNGDLIYGLDFLLGDGWAGFNTAFTTNLIYETFSGGNTTGSGDVVVSNGTMVGFADTQGFEMIRVAASRGNIVAFGEFQAIVIDDLKIGSAATIPEPSTLAIFALGMIGLASRRFKKQS